MGGQRDERKEWIHYFNNTSIVFFVANLDGYAKTLWEDCKTLRLNEDIDLFGQIVNLKCFERTHFILILNKCDLFQKSFVKFGFLDESIYKELDHREGDQSLIEFFLTKFLNKIKMKNNKTKHIHCVVSSAIDQECVMKIMQYVYTKILHH